MEAELRALRMKDLKKRAKSFGVTPDELEDAEDEDDAKGCVVQLVLDRAAALKALPARELKAKARAFGVDMDDFDDCFDAADPKEAIMGLMLKAAAGASASAPTPTSSKEGKPPPPADVGSPAASLSLSEASPPPSSDSVSPPPHGLAQTSSAGSPAGGRTIMQVVVEIKQQLGLDGSLNPKQTAATGREELGLPAAPDDMKLKESLMAICLELGIETGWSALASTPPPSEGTPPARDASPRDASPSLPPPPAAVGESKIGSDLIMMPGGSSLVIKGVIGRGGQATVFRGRLTEHGHTKTVAVKKLASGSSLPERKKFQSELMTLTRAAQRCEHVCRVLGAVDHEGQLCVLMKEYVESMDALMLREGALPVSRALQYGVQIMRGLVSLHDERIVVLDLKPANILVDEHDQLAISDSGLSHLSQATLSASRGVGGTPVFMAPEQFDSSEFGPPTFKSDIWAFGCVLIALFQGHNPWQGLHDREIMMQVSVKSKAPTIPADVPEEIAAVVAKCLEISPKRRPAVSDVLGMLNAALASLSGGDKDSDVKLLSCPIGRSGRHIFLSYRELDRQLAMTVKQVR